jgi:CRISPR-associated protein Cas2
MRVKKNYLICYDITNPKRLAKLSKYVEKNAFRIQKSIYLLPHATKEELQNIKEQIEERIEKEEDDVRIYTIKSSGFRAGIAVDLDNPFIVT